MLGAKVSHLFGVRDKKPVATISSDKNGPRTVGFPTPCPEAAGEGVEVKDLTRERDKRGVETVGNTISEVTSRCGDLGPSRFVSVNVLPR